MEQSTPMMRQYHRIKLRHPDTLVFFRLGDFYEMFFDDAVVGSRELEITLTSRNNDRDGIPIPMCGIPHHALQNYLPRLIRKGYKVAICEQVEDPRRAKGVVRREVTRVVTPGTVTGDGLLDPRENNYLAGLSEDEDVLGASFLDVSTGEFWVTQHSGEHAPERLRQELLHFQPREIVIPQSRAASLAAKVGSVLPVQVVRTPQPDWIYHPDYARRTLREHFGVASLEGLGINGSVQAAAAAGSLLYYVRETQKSALGHITGLRLLEETGFLKMDDSTVRNLELVEGLDGNRRWTLLSALDLTRTGMGGRLLRRWMLRPSLDVGEIEARLDAVEELAAGIVGLGRLTGVLSGIQDMERLVARVTLETANPRDLISLGRSLRALPEIDRILRDYHASLLSLEIDFLEDVADLIEKSLNEEAPASVGEGRIIRTGFNAELDELRDIASSGKTTIARMEAEERERTGIPSLKVRYNRVFGYFIEITKTHLDSVPADYIRKQTLAGAERYITPQLKEYEDKVLSAEERIVELEKALFLEIRSRVAGEAERIQRAARIVAQLDVLAAFAEASRRNRYVRPRLDNSLRLKIVAGRHPVLELRGDEPFVPNDLDCAADGDQMLILTGPNMGGKSTYLRQNALIAIMAQMGSFVPADSAQIGLVDRVFTRVGASDNLARGRSTFMVEMIETARILNTATRRSLILLDEVGRGTATFDGLSIAWSVAEYLMREESRRARTLFATHYQELTRLEELYEGARNYCVTVSEGGTSIIFYHKVLPGTANKSYGIEVARLAGVPAPVLDRAREILARLERKQLNLAGKPRGSTVGTDAFAELQKGLFEG
jgi:DNA mismatch repair protein MutS